MGITSGDISTFALMGAAGAAAFLTPAKKIITSSCKRSYKKQKLHFFVVSMLSLLLLVNLGNRTAADHRFSPPAAMFLTATGHTITKTESELHPKDQDRGDRTDKMALKVGLTILSVLSLIALLSLGAYVMCALICMEEVFGGLLLGFGIQGFGVVAFIFSINAIWGKGVFRKKLPPMVS